MKSFLISQLMRATFLEAGIDGTLIRKLHVIKMDDGDGISMLETSGTLISDGDGESYEGPPALETVMMTARMTMTLNILMILLFLLVVREFGS